MPPAVFVYGTLMPGESRWPALAADAVAWEEADAAGRLYDTGRGYPAAVFGADGRIAGIRVVLPAGRLVAVVRRLDDIEGAGVLYRRVTVETSAGSAVSYEWIGDMGCLDVIERWPPA